MALVLVSGTAASAPDTGWPDPDSESRPWLRWTWPGGKPDTELEAIARAGFGGVEVIAGPATEANTALVEWLSPGWVEMTSIAAAEASRLGLGFDLACQAGSAPGGSFLPDGATATTLEPFIASHPGGLLETPLPEGTPSCLGAWPRSGPPVDLLPFVDPDARILRWDAPAGPWRIYGSFDQHRVARIGDPAPGAEGPALDPYSPGATALWLQRLDTAYQFADPPRARTLEFTPLPGATWTADLFPAFQRRRGYDLRAQLPALFGEVDEGTTDRVLADYRETIAELQFDALTAWHLGSHAQGTLTRAYGQASAGNPVDLHSVPDIPGMRLDAPPDDEKRLQLRFAASAARLTTKPLVTATYRAGRDHPLSPAELKRATDLLFLAGANHLALELSPASPLWRDATAFTAMLARCQGVLQTGAPDTEVLLYYPAHDFHTERGGIPDEADERTRWLRATAFQRAAETLDDHGIPFDVVTDRLLADATADRGRIIVGGLPYRSLVLAEVRRLSDSTANHLLELARRGAPIAILGSWPEDVPGLPTPDIRRGNLFTAMQKLRTFPQVLEGNHPVRLLERHEIAPEAMADLGLSFVRRSHAEGHHYLVVNRGPGTVDAWVPLARPWESAVFMDPRFIRRTGLAPMRTRDDRQELHLVLEPGESRILRTFHSRQATGPAWPDHSPSAGPRTIAGTWSVSFPEGELSPADFETPVLGSWGTLADPLARSFQGTATYGIGFEVPADGKWLLDLGEVAHTARVRIDGKEAGVTFAPPHQLDISRFVSGGAHALEIEVTNLSPELPSGLLGPVRLIPLEVPE